MIRFVVVVSPSLLFVRHCCVVVAISVFVVVSILLPLLFVVPLWPVLRYSFRSIGF